MTNKLTATEQKELTHKIILGCHPKCKTIEEALEKELVLGCRVVFDHCHELSHSGWHSHNGEECTYICRSWDIAYGYTDSNAVVKTSERPFEHKILGLPLTFSRIATALGDLPRMSLDLRNTQDRSPYKLCGSRDYGHTAIKTDWQLTKSGRSLTLFEQSDETQRAIYNLFKS